MNARTAYYAQRKAHRASLRMRDVMLEHAGYADSPQASIDREAARLLLVPAPRGYGRRALDPLIVRRAKRSEWLDVKAANRVGEAKLFDVYLARAELTGESPAGLLRLTLKRAQCAAQGIPAAIAERYYGDVRFFTPCPETLRGRYPSRELTETERLERDYPSDSRRREMRAAARKPLPFPRDLPLPSFEWSKAA